MKKKFLVIGAIIFGSIAFTSCGGGNKSDEGKSSSSEQTSGSSESTPTPTPAPENTESTPDEGESTASESEATVSESSSSSGSDCEDLLKGYEEFADNYIAYYKKAKNNPTDPTLMADAANMMSEAASWAEKTESCKNDAEFGKKILAVYTKISKAALSGM